MFTIPTVLALITVPFDFVTYSRMHFTNPILIFDCTMILLCKTLSNNKSLFEYHKVIKSVGREQIFIEPF